MLRDHHRHLIWDWNGTLLDDLELCVDVINRMLARHRLPAVDRDRYLAIFDFPVRDFYARLGFDLSGDGFPRLSTEFISTYEARRLDAGLHRGVPALLDAVATSGRAQSILSAYRHETLLEILDHHDLRRRFAKVAGLDNIHAHSKVELGRSLVRELGLPAESILLVGDTLHDLEVARDLGVDCALVAAGHQSAERLRKSGARVFQDIGALAEALGLPVA